MDDLSQSAPANRIPTFSPLAIALMLMVFTLGGFVTLGAVTQLMNIAFGLWFTELFIFLGLPFVVLRTVGRSPLRYGAAMPLPPPSTVAIGFLLGLVNLFAIGMPLQLLSYHLVPESIRESLDAARVFKDQTPVELVFVLLGVGVLAAVCEEFFFRGVFLRGLRTRLKSDGVALLVSGLVFAFFHLEPVGFLARTELGILFGWLYLRTRSIWPAVMAHAANNLTSTTMYFLSVGQEQPAAEAGAAMAPEEIRQVLMMALIALVPLAALVAWAHRTLKPVVPEVDEALVRPRSFWPTLAPWLAGAIAALALLFAIDRRGVELNFIDLRYPLPRLENDARADERAALKELRDRARSGEVPTDQYREQRAALAGEQR